MAPAGSFLARKRRTLCRNCAKTWTREGGWLLAAQETEMAYFSDRVVSFNRLVIAAAVAYAGAVTFAHADQIHFVGHTQVEVNVPGASYTVIGTLDKTPHV
jgi:hypothetical protein